MQRAIFLDDLDYCQSEFLGGIGSSMHFQVFINKKVDPLMK